tara:strand:- start:3397 stop:3816 length:420 start_codon:yes stop_codon:yes gene_type:complete
MAALTPVAASVTLKGSGSVTNGIAGEALSQGQVAFQSSSDNKWYSASASSDGNLSGKSVGIILCPSDAADERAIVATTAGDEVDLGTTVTKGSWFVVGGATGVLEEYSDLSSSENVTFVGYGNDNTNLVLAVKATGFTK